MTDTLTTDHADSGEILPWDTVVLEVAEPTRPTRPLTKYLRTLPPVRALRLADAHPEQAQDTGELPLIATGAELAVAARTHPLPRPNGPTNPPIPPPPPPAVAVRPDGYRSRHRAPAPVWVWLLTSLGSGVVGGALTSGAVLLWAVTR